MSGVLSEKVVAFAHSQRVGHLATVDGDGRPHVVPVCFAVHGGDVYTPLDVKPKRVAPLRLRRVRNLLGHPDVCLVVDRYDEDWTRLAWVQLRGRAGLVDDPAERGAAIAALRARYPQYRNAALESCPLIRVSVTEVVAWAAAGTL
ncbi:MAG: TIGR03668 family PPOX class F420-dependent oxidoreductase [Armatimonadota bacterium]|nr:TIGR03668 family PPOX class F420-dependent oxidoreductase [Armatimonadota bacterium]